ncbi:MAG: hypothetical protein HYU81_00015 [Candidatus Brennerbacteria bacterium]|nr:hypothetical protein [Candidatus Brennerbacteria bacterium]
MKFATLFVVYGPFVAEWIFAFCAAGWYLSRRARPAERNEFFIRRIVLVSIFVYFLLALVTSYVQYAIWKGDSFSQNLLPPHQSVWYFVKYAGTHFWLTLFFSLIASGTFYALLRSLKRRNERFFEEGEMELGALAAFLVGWPRIIVFLPITFLAVVVIAGIKIALKKGAYTTLGPPFLVGLAITLAAGLTFLQMVGLESLVVIPGAR